VAEHIFLSAENALFCYRVQSLSKAGLKRFMHQFHHLRTYFLHSTKTFNLFVELAEIRELLSVLDDQCIDWKSVIAGYNSFVQKRCTDEYTEFPGSFHVAIPFRFVKRLVAQRKVLLSSGMALLSPSQLPLILAAVFRTWMKCGIRLAQRRRPHVINGDDRFRWLFSECRVKRFVILLIFLILRKPVGWSVRPLH